MILHSLSTHFRVRRYVVTGKHVQHGRVELRLSSYAAATLAWGRLLEARFSVAGIARELRS